MRIKVRGSEGGARDIPKELKDSVLRIGPECLPPQELKADFDCGGLMGNKQKVTCLLSYPKAKANNSSQTLSVLLGNATTLTG